MRDYSFPNLSGQTQGWIAASPITLATQQGTDILVAEREGFEPSERTSRSAVFETARFSQLSHLSAQAAFEISAVAALPRCLLRNLGAFLNRRQQTLLGRL